MRIAVRFFVLFTLIMLTACYEVTLTDVSHEPKNIALIGTQYEVAGELDAYEIRSTSNENADWITLIPPPGIQGYEVRSKERIELGSIVTIRKVAKVNYLIGPDYAFVVSVEYAGTSVAKDARIELSRGNEGEDRLELNPAIYRKIERYNNRAE